MKTTKPDWLKSKGYPHITGQIDVSKGCSKLLSKIQDPTYIAKHAFFPLLHSIIKERKFKKTPNNKRAHSYINENGNSILCIKERPLHYANHFDSLVFGYYAEIIQEKYEEQISQHIGLQECITAYRRIPSEIEGKNKSTIHFAFEIFDEIRKRSLGGEECYVLAFDIKSFFSSLNHNFLKDAWASILGTKRLSPDHYNVFRAATQFSYIFIDELKKEGIRYDEKRRAAIRNKIGIDAFFESPRDFREQIKSGDLKIHKYPFRDKTGVPIGIPQGLPISAILANLYLLSFDIKVLNTLIYNFGCFYRRYSDDIIVICKKENVEFIETYISDAMKESKVELSPNKTEKFIFKNRLNNSKLTSVKITDSGEKVGVPLNYLGFEFNGQKTLIKSSNLSKFYRRMIYSVKSKANRAKKLTMEGEKPIIFRRQLYKLYTTRPLKDTKIRTSWKKISKNKFGDFYLTTIPKTKILRSNYLSYVDRASEIMKEPSIKKQIRNHKKIFNQAICKHLKKEK